MSLLEDLFAGAGRLGAEASARNQRAAFLEAQRAADIQRATDQQRIYNLHMADLRQQAEGHREGQADALAQAAQGALHLNQLSAGSVCPTTVRTMFTRWMDIRESEDELQEFLQKCVAYGQMFQKPTKMTVDELDS